MDKSENNSKNKQTPVLAAMAVIPVTDLLKLQKGYISYLEDQLEDKEKTIPSEIEEMAFKMMKVQRDSAMKLADVIRDALNSGNYESLADLEKTIRKGAFGSPEADGL